MPIDFASYPIWVNLAVFTVAAALVWFAGTRLSREADIIAARSGLGQAFIGLFLLAGATSLPEIATTVTASLKGEPSLATNNLLGGVAMQTAVLAIADLTVVAGALTYFTPRPNLLLQGVMLVALLGLTLCGIAAGEPVTILGMGGWPVLLFVAYLLVLDQTRRYRGHKRWQAQESEDEQQAVSERERAAQGQREQAEQSHRSMSNRRLAFSFGGLSLLTLAVGWTIASTGSALAAQTGLGAGFIGATLVAISTSLPEVSTTISATRRGSYALAVSNIFGSNVLMVALLFVADISYRSGPIMEAVDRSTQFSAALGLFMTCLYLWGMLERRDRTIFRMGIDSALVLSTYLGGLVVLYTLR